MNISAHNPKFLNGLSITSLLSRIAILTSQLDPGWHFYWVHHHNFGHSV